VPKPKAGFAFPPVICEQQTQVTLTDTSSVPGNMSSIGGWWWNINGAVSVDKNPLFVPAIPGPYPVQLVAFTTEGCRSDTVTSLLPVHYRPDAVFGWSHPLCENEMVRFNNTSFMPAAASPDFIARWYWQFDNIPASGSQNPGYNFGPGPHQATLVAESNYGCKSASADSQLVITTVATEAVVFFHRERETSPYLLGGLGFASPDVIYGTKESRRVDEGPFLVVGAGIEHFVRPRMSLDFSVRGYAQVGNSELSVLSQLTAGIHLYPGD